MMSPILYQQLKAFCWANLLMNLTTKPLYKIRFLKYQNNQSLLFNRCQTSQQQQVKINYLKVHHLSQELLDLLPESPLDDECKANTITNAAKKLEMTLKLISVVLKTEIKQKTDIIWSKKTGTSYVYQQSLQLSLTDHHNWELHQKQKFNMIFHSIIKFHLQKANKM